jgi:hypothetical protein
MKIIGIEGMSRDEVIEEVERGGRFVLFTYTISLIFVTFRQPTPVYFIRAGRWAVGKGFGPTIMTFALGWWGIPWGPIFSIGSIARNLTGGKNVTVEVMDNLI